MSEGGKPAETQEVFWTRVFSHIRYKGRAVTVQDYEDLILEKFADVLQVKCIPALLNESLCRPSAKLKVTAVIVEKNHSAYLPFPLRPKVARQLLKEIKASVLEQTTPFMLPGKMLEFEAVNPSYRDISFRIAVHFSDKVNTQENKRKLLEDLSYFINPWLICRDQPMKFGCWLNYGEIVSYLQNLSYVKAILGLKLSTADGNELCPPGQYAFKPNEVAILLPELCTVEVVDDLENYNPSDYRGIGFMEVGLDFYVK